MKSRHKIERINCNTVFVIEFHSTITKNVLFWFSKWSPKYVQRTYQKRAKNEVFNASNLTGNSRERFVDLHQHATELEGQKAIFEECVPILYLGLSFLRRYNFPLRIQACFSEIHHFFSWTFSHSLYRKEVLQEHLQKHIYSWNGYPTLKSLSNTSYQVNLSKSRYVFFHLF